MIRRIRLKFVYKVFLLSASVVILYTLFHLFTNNANKNKKNKIPVTALPANFSPYDGNILSKIINVNQKSTLLNANKFRSLVDSDLVIVIQVHNRLHYLSNLIDSLSRVKSIDEVLLVFSHDVYDEEINQLIQSITFSKVVQIFFPFSIQVWSHSFPGFSTTDCSRNMKKNEALQINCTNAGWADTYGHYRESRVTQTKHHWWWKLNYVLDHLVHTSSHQGDFLLLEEDYYVAPDLLHMWKLMKQYRNKLATTDSIEVNLLTLGNYDKNYNYNINSNQLQLIEWFSSKHNIAFTIDRNLWARLKSCDYEFCTYDDYNWDWSLQYLNTQCLDEKLLTLVSVVPRVHHIGKCGLHHKDKNCDIKLQKDMLEQAFQLYSDNLFPLKLLVMRRPPVKLRKLINNGGWSDLRDHELCTQYNLLFDQILRLNPNFKMFQKQIWSSHV